MSSNVLKKLTYGLNLKANNKMPDGPRPLGYGNKNKTLNNTNNKRKLDNEDMCNIKKKIRKDDEVKQKKKPLTLERIIQMKLEKIAHIRNANCIHVNGSDIPDPIVSFDELVHRYNMQEHLIENLKSMDMIEPTPVQMQAITAILQGRNLVVCAPTGSGKTLAFSLPLLHSLGSHQQGGFRAIVLAPTRELAVQIQQEMLRMVKGSSLEIHFLMKSTTSEQRDKWLNSDILITTPKKLIYACKKFKKEISFKNIQYLVVDESDKLFEDGKGGFRDQLAVIYKKCQSSFVKTLFFSATFSPEIEQWCENSLHNLLKICIGARNSAAKTIDQQLIYAGSEAGKLLALRNIFTEGFLAPVLIFTQSKQRSEELHRELSDNDMKVEVIHSEKTVSQRDAIVKSFQLGKIWVLICTDVMARGIDFKQVNLVINFDFPTSPVAYIHRIGRTGRAGKPGKAITLFTDDDVTYLRSIVNLMREAGCDVPEYMLHIKKAPRKLVKEMSKSAPKREPISYEGEKDYKEKKLRKKKNRNKQKKVEQAIGNME